MNSVYKNPCNYYTLGWLLYFMQGTLYPYGSLFTKVLLVLLLGYSLFFVVINIKLFDSLFFRVLLTIVFVYLLYTLLYYSSGESFIHNGIVKGKFESFKTICLSIFPVLCYYGYGCKGYLTISWFKLGAIVLLVLSISSFYSEQATRLASAIEEGSTREEFTINAGYRFAAIIPILVLMNSKQWYKYLLFSIAFLFTLFAMKRGAIVVCVLSSAIFMWHSLIKGKGASKIGVFVFIIISLALFAYGVSYLLENSDYFNYRLQQTMEGDSSDRDVLYSNMIEHFRSESSFFRFCFGYGIDGTGRLFGNGAHNDWIELAIDMGLLGLFVYFIYWVLFYKTWRSSRSIENVCTALGIILLSEFLKSFFSFSINDFPIQQAPALGYCLAAVELNKRRSSHCRNRTVKR